jgi:hypothetical protein
MSEEYEEKQRNTHGLFCDKCGVKSRGKKFPVIGKRRLCQKCMKEEAEMEKPGVPMQIFKKLLSEEFTKFKLAYFADKNPVLRLGQAFLNKYFPDVVDSNLFYEEDAAKAEKIIWEHYIDYK